jgi:hypothetical protein
VVGPAPRNLRWCAGVDADVRRSTLPATIVCVLALVPSASARTPDCRTTGRTVVANSKARVYLVPPSQTSRPGGEYFGCAFARPGRRSLGGDFSGSSAAEYVQDIQLRGRFVAYAPVTCSDICEWRALVADLRTRKTLLAAHGENQLYSVLMTRERSLAILNDPSDYGGPVPDYRVSKVEESGKTLLDRSAEIDPFSLAVSRHRMYWMHGDEARSARIR